MSRTTHISTLARAASGSSHADLRPNDVTAESRAYFSCMTAVGLFGNDANAFVFCIFTILVAMFSIVPAIAAAHRIWLRSHAKRGVVEQGRRMTICLRVIDWAQTERCALHAGHAGDCLPEKELAAIMNGATWNATDAYRRGFETGAKWAKERRAK